MLNLGLKDFTIAKAGNQSEECEDAWSYDKAARRLAIADGASDAFESRLWAKALVEAYVRKPPSPDADSILDWLVPPAREWKEGIQWGRLPWYAEEKARRGSFSTLLGVTFGSLEDDQCDDSGVIGHWSAIAVGDACLFHIRHENLLVSFPVRRSADFGVTPFLLSTRPDYSRRSLEGLQSCEGDCQPGDTFVLATDALAAWCLQREEKGDHPWEDVALLTPDKFVATVGQLREAGAMRNDDVTLVLCQLHKDIDKPMLQGGTMSDEVSS